MFIREIVILSLCCSLCSLPLSAQAAGQSLQATGTVTVNGRPVKDSGVLSVGDTIETGGGSSASAMAKGLLLNLGENSRVRLQQGAVAFGRGSVLVTTTGLDWQVAIGKTMIVPTSGTAKIEVSTKEDIALIKLLEGAAVLNEATQSTALQIGFTVARPLAGSLSAGAKHSRKAPIVAAVAGGAVVGIIFAAKGKGEARQPVSPSAP